MKKGGGGGKKVPKIYYVICEQSLINDLLCIELMRTLLPRPQVNMFININRDSAEWQAERRPVNENCEMKGCAKCRLSQFFFQCRVA